MKKDRILKLEKWREDNGLSKADMARFFDVTDRNYNNWTYRGSLPKRFFDRADIILSGNARIDVNERGGRTIVPAETSPYRETDSSEERELLRLYQAADKEERAMFLRMLRAAVSDENSE